MTKNIHIDLQAVIFSFHENSLNFLNIERNKISSLVAGPYLPTIYKTLASNIANLIKEQTGLDINYVEQLYSFGDSYRKSDNDDIHLSIAYLAVCKNIDETTNIWINIYDFFPYENWLSIEHAPLSDFILPKLYEWANEGEKKQFYERSKRIDRLYGYKSWYEELVLERYELLYEAKLVTENNEKMQNLFSSTGKEMIFDHRRILATAFGRLRAKLRYQPIIFSMLDEKFTLNEIQKKIETIFGFKLHKQNFRRSFNQFVVATNEIYKPKKGRPAKLFIKNEELILNHSIHNISLPRLAKKAKYFKNS